jgi:hypothetical protein
MKAVKTVAILGFTLFLVIGALSLPAYTQSEKIDSDKIDAALILFRDIFYVNDDAKFKYNLFEYRDFVLQESYNEAWNSNVAVVTRFESNLLQSKLLKNVANMEEAEGYIDAHIKLHPYNGIEIPELQFELPNGEVVSRYWVGQKSFGTMDEAKEALSDFAKNIKKQGVSFKVFVTELQENGVPFEEPEEIILTEDEDISGGPRNLEEEVMMYLWEKADLEQFSGKSPDEPWFIWQSVFESTWRSTNFSYGGFNDLVGFFSNRVTVRGVKMPFGSSIDPLIEGIITFSSDGREFDNNFIGRFGAEYRPFRGIKWLDKYWWTSWIKNLRGHIDYANRFATKDPITGSPDHDWRAGVDVFKEWGINIPEEGKPDFWWGEYFGEYDFRKTNFSYLGENNGYNTFLANTRLLLGIKYPTIPLPANPINNNFTVMPYMGWEWINNNHLGKAFFENRYFFLAGVRWMPFRDKRHERREWLYKTKIFFEYAGIGHVQYTKAGPPEDDPAFDVNNDFRFGVNISSNRF